MRQSDEVTQMSGYACDIAVSEIFGIPAERMRYLVLSVECLGDGLQRNKLLTGPGSDDVDWLWAAAAMENMAAQIRSVL